MKGFEKMKEERERVKGLETMKEEREGRGGGGA